MEGSDPFSQGVETSSEDPFGGDAFGDFEQHEPTGETPDQNGTGELKTVDKEGNEVTADPTPAAGPVQESAGQTEAPSDPTPPSTESSPQATPAASPPPGEPAPSATEGAVATSEASTPASTEASVGVTPEQSDGDQGDPTPTSSTPPPADDAPTSSSSGSEGDEEDAPLPEEPKDKRGRATARRYVILRVVAPGEFKQVHWYEDSNGKMLTKREPGSKRQTVALCKNAEDALKIGFAACGGPQDGVNLVATAALHFQPKVVKPLPPEPSKQRLQIS